MRDDPKPREEQAQQLSFWPTEEQQGEEQRHQPWHDLLEGLLRMQECLRPHASRLGTWLTLLGNSYPEVFTGKQQKGKKQRWSVFTIDQPVQDDEQACFSHWPSAGIFDADAGVGIAVELPEHPHEIHGSSLWDVIEKGPVAGRYFISPNAARGMLRRAARMKRRLFPPLQRAAEILAQSDQGEGDRDVREIDDEVTQ